MWLPLLFWWQGERLANSLSFQYHPEIIKTFPDIQAGVILAQELKNGTSSKLLQEAYFAEQKKVIEKIGDTPLSELPTLVAWRGAFRKFGMNPTKYRSAPEALLRRLTKKGNIPSINTLVDIGNLVSIRYALPVAIFDVSMLSSGITVHFSDGTERFTPLFEDEVKFPVTGEVIFSEDTNMVVARRWCWRQSDESAARPKTTSAIICTEALHTSAQADIQAAINDLTQLIQEHAGGTLVSGNVNAEFPSFGN